MIENGSLFEYIFYVYLVGVYSSDCVWFPVVLLICVTDVPSVLYSLLLEFELRELKYNSSLFLYLNFMQTKGKLRSL